MASLVEPSRDIHKPNTFQFEPGEGRGYGEGRIVMIIS
jgi:hypothetical protein